MVAESRSSELAEYHDPVIRRQDRACRKPDEQPVLDHARDGVEGGCKPVRVGDGVQMRVEDVVPPVRNERGFVASPQPQLADAAEPLEGRRDGASGSAKA